MTDLDLDQDHGPAENHLDATDFDAFIVEELATRPRERLTLYGKTYVLPESLPIMFTLLMTRVQDSQDPDDVAKLLAILFGGDVLNTWAEHGMTDRQLGILLIFSAANVRRPGSVTLPRAAELYDEQEAGKAAGPNRATRRAKTGKKKRSGAPS
ncbi:hypothetical protein ACFRSX_03445 [Streptomyces goshikiensis]|uniref:hypothetical protein n=1 Tax=Streptomyces TaxID=1883 RepID=UPI000C2732D4|nr:hypothetical protein [Streptomyces sp. CB02120-2]PJN19365.1 hypothetical protein CG724_08935 [Streptomyces sp. CB02120-2]